MSLRQRLITTFLLLALVTIVTGVVNLYIQQVHIEEMEETILAPGAGYPPLVSQT